MINEVFQMCRSFRFDRQRATEILSQIDINQRFSVQDGGGSSTLLYEAVMHTNMDMIRLLLDHGADPNVMPDDDTSLLWDLQYPGFMESATAEQQLKTVKLLLDHGAVPDRNALAEEDGLMDHVLFHILNDPEDSAWKYRCSFFILLLSYGFTTPYVRQTMLAKIDNRHLDQYRFYRTPYENAPFRAVICGPHGFVFAYL